MTDDEYVRLSVLIDADLVLETPPGERVDAVLRELEPIVREMVSAIEQESLDSRVKVH
ncbi:MAG TPA: hypothetical protein VF161_12665 [Steroidobacteraceae bacterium]